MFLGRGRKLKALNLVVSVLLVEAIILCLIVSFFLLYKSNSAAQIQSTATLLIFNIIFLSLFFYLDGTLNLKLSLLVVGNYIGLCWNYIYNILDVVGSKIYGSPFSNFCLIFFPFLSALWVVSFWSLSLTIVHSDSRVIKEF
jgi:hypothetical protein